MQFCCYFSPHESKPVKITSHLVAVERLASFQPRPEHPVQRAGSFPPPSSPAGLGLASLQQEDGGLKIRFLTWTSPPPWQRKEASSLSNKAAVIHPCPVPQPTAGQSAPLFYTGYALHPPQAGNMGEKIQNKEEGYSTPGFLTSWQFFSSSPLFRFSRNEEEDVFRAFIYV